MTKAAHFLNPRWRTAGILKIVKSLYLSEKLSDFDEIFLHYIMYWTRLQSRVRKLKFLEFKMAAAAILKITFLATTHRPIVRFRRNFVCGSRTACRQKLHDKNCKVLKSNLANGRHFENRYIAISQWKIVRFYWNLLHYIIYWTGYSHVTKNWNF